MHVYFIKHSINNEFWNTEIKSPTEYKKKTPGYLRPRQASQSKNDSDRNFYLVIIYS